MFKRIFFAEKKIAIFLVLQSRDTVGASVDADDLVILTPKVHEHATDTVATLLTLNEIETVSPKRARHCTMCNEIWRDSIYYKYAATHSMVHRTCVDFIKTYCQTHSTTEFEKLQELAIEM